MVVTYYVIESIFKLMSKLCTCFIKIKNRNFATFIRTVFIMSTASVNNFLKWNNTYIALYSTENNIFSETWNLP